MPTLKTSNDMTTFAARTLNIYIAARHYREYLVACLSNIAQAEPCGCEEECDGIYLAEAGGGSAYEVGTFTQI
jgi:hypothetical protein